MMKSNETTLAQISANNEAATSASLLKSDTAVANSSRKATQDAGRVHVGGGMMRF
jgi:hypothetical protein